MRGATATAIKTRQLPCSVFRLWIRRRPPSKWRLQARLRKNDEKHFRVLEHYVVWINPGCGCRSARSVLAKTHNRQVVFRRNLLGLGFVVDVVGNKTSYQQGQVSVKSN